MPNTNSIYRIFQNLINHTSHSFIVALDTEYRFLVSNEAHRKMFLQLFGREVVVGKSMLDMLEAQPEAYQKQKATWQRALKGEEFITLENHTAQDNETRYYEVSYSPLLDGAGKLLGATAITRDVTEKIEYQQEIIYQNHILAEQDAQKTILLQDLERQHEELATQEEEIRQNNEQLSTINNQLITEREKLLAATQELEDRNFELDQILYRTSHDIRSPIASVLGLINIIKEEDDMRKVREYVAFVEKRMKDLDRFTSSMLAYGKEQRSEVRLDMIDFEEIIEHCWTDLQYLPTFSRLRKTLHIDKKCLAFYSDAFRISIILSNILSNAVKYQNPHIDDNFVAIQILQEDEYATITIQDNGIGVEQTYIDKIFDMFFRATEKSEGSGLGMYIVQQTVERLDGNIKFQSVLGEGTTITIQIPNAQLS